MANYHCTVKMISRSGGKSTVAALAYRTGTKLVDQRTGEVWDYTKKNVGHVEILIPENAPKWISDISELCKTDKQAALQKFSDIIEAAEKRKDSQVYREIEFSLPNELTKEKNIEWATDYLNDYAVKRGMVCVPSFHFDYDEKEGIAKPHCHAILLTRELTEEGLSPKKQLEWNEKPLLHDWREQCAAYANNALKENGFEERVDHRSYAERGITEIEAQPKMGRNILEMTEKGIQTDKQKLFDMVKLKNQFQILKNPELVFSIVTSNHSTFTYQDVAKVLHRYIDDPQQYQILYNRLLASNELVCIDKQDDAKETPAIYTTRKMLSNEIELVRKAESLASQNTHPVKQKIIEKVIAHHNKKLEKYGGMTPDQERAIRHMLGPQQLSCVVGFAGSGKTTSLEASNDAWKAMGYMVLGVAPTGKAADAMEGSGIRSMTLHKFLRAHETGHEKIGRKTVLVLDEGGMVDSRRMNQLLTIIAKSGAKHVVMGDNGQTQSVEAGPAFRLVTDRVKPVALETIVRQNVDWQRHASQFFGKQETRKALEMYQEHGLLKTVGEKDIGDRTVVEQYCISRQISGRIWKEMGEDLGLQKATTVQVKEHQDFDLYVQWRDDRQKSLESIIKNFDTHESELKAKGLDLRPLIEKWRQAPLGQTSEIVRNMENSLREMSYKNVVDTRVEAKKVLVAAWARDRAASPNESHLMIAYSNKDAASLNKSARSLMREAGVITGKDFTFTTVSLKDDDFGREVETKQNQEFAKGDRLLFMRNDGTLKVRNGTLGSITEISKTKIKVLIDGDDKREVSFSPRLYPYFNNGWGATIHKAQGATVDHVKKLNTFDEYRNLSYVGMTRHRHTLETYGSDLDFWREEKIIDRLSRVQEKLSGTDYLDYNKAFEQLKTDERTLWHERKIQQGIDFVNAVKVTGKSVMDIVLNRPREILLDPETFKSFDHSEEKRSVEFFGDKKSPIGKGEIQYREDNSERVRVSSKNVDLKSSGAITSAKGDKIDKGYSSINLTNQGKNNLDQIRETSSDTIRDHSTSNPLLEIEPILPVMHAFPTNFKANEVSHLKFRTDNQMIPSEGISNANANANEKSESLSGNSISNSLPVKQKMLSQKHSFPTNLPIEELAHLKFTSEKPEISITTEKTSTLENKDDNVLNLGSPSGKSATKDSSQKNNPPENKKKEQKFEHICHLEKAEFSLDDLRNDLATRVDDITFRLIRPLIGAEPTKVTSEEFRFGSKGSLSIVRQGEKQGTFYDHESKKGGSILDLIARGIGHEGNIHKAILWGKDYIGGKYGDITVTTKIPVSASPNEKETKNKWQVISPVPAHVKIPTPTIIMNNKYLRDPLEGHKVLDVHVYRNEDNSINFLVGRTTDPACKTRPLSWRHLKGSNFCAWAWKGPEGNRPLYGLERLGKNTDNPVLVVEGEKTADAARKLYPGYTVVTWSFGVESIDITNWAPLTGRNIVIWPDNDEPGFKAAKDIVQTLGELNKNAQKSPLVATISVPKGFPHKWDLADEFPEGWDKDKAKKLIDEPIDKFRSKEGKERPDSAKLSPSQEKSAQQHPSIESKIVKVLSTSYDLDPKSIDPKTINQIQGQLKIIEEAYKAESVPLSGHQKNHHLKQLCMINQLSKDCLDQYTDQSTPSQGRETAIQKSIINAVYLEKSNSAHIRPPYTRLETANYYNNEFKKDVAKAQEVIQKQHPALDDHSVKSLATTQVTLRGLTENELTFSKFVQQKAEIIQANQGSILSAARDLAKEVSPYKGGFELKETEESARKSIVSQMVRQGPLTETSQYSQAEAAKNTIVKDLSNHQRGIQQAAIQNRIQMEQRQHEQMQR